MQYKFRMVPPLLFFGSIAPSLLPYNGATKFKKKFILILKTLLRVFYSLLYVEHYLNLCCEFLQREVLCFRICEVQRCDGIEDCPKVNKTSILIQCNEA